MDRSCVPGSSQLLADHEPETRPDVIDSCHLVVHHPGRQEEVAQQVFGDVSGHPGSLLRPCTPDGTIRWKSRHRLDEPTFQIICFGREDHHYGRGTGSSVRLFQLGGKRFFPDGLRLDLELVEERAFGSGLIYAGYRTR